MLNEKAPGAVIHRKTAEIIVADGELILARALRSKFIQKFEQRKARLLPELDTSGLSLLSKPQHNIQFPHYT